MKTSYFRFASLVISLMRDQLPHTVGMYVTGFIMFGIYKNSSLYTVLLNAVGGEILLLPVHVRHVGNAQTWLPMLLYRPTPLGRIAFKSIKFINVIYMFHRHSRL